MNNRLNNRLQRVNKHPTGCQTGCSTALNRLNVCLHDADGCSTTAECLYTRYNWLFNRFDHRLQRVNWVWQWQRTIISTKHQNATFRLIRSDLDQSGVNRLNRTEGSERKLCSDEKKERDQIAHNEKRREYIIIVRGSEVTTLQRTTILTLCTPTTLSSSDGERDSPAFCALRRRP